MVDKHPEPQPLLAVKLSPAENPTAEAGADAAAPINSSALPAPEPEVVPTVSLTKVFRNLLAQITRERITTAALACVSIGALFLFWYIGTKYRVEFYIRFKNVPTPYEVFQQLTQVGLSNKYLVNIAISVRRILLGFFIAMAIGVPLGLAIGKYQRVRDLFMPVVEILRPIPAIAWVPMSIMLWPNNEASIVFITFIGAFFPILLNTIHGVHSLDGVLIRAAKCLGASEFRLFLNVILPGSLPHIFTGLAVGMGVAWVSLIAAEMISGQFGVGYFTWEAYSLVDYPAIVLGMITIGFLGLACSGIIRMVGSLLMPWLAFAPGGKR
ncbi:ABC transporter permease [Bradyrhizobium sp. WSM 1791]|uniref:ABC transporter permease n=2 Tax=Bradyrhizobium australiense TaxID=2721161 RepID=A0A7Y4GP61_9BRAD|nr:ABC transporter permease [Bradyrhizobium australiense]